MLEIIRRPKSATNALVTTLFLSKCVHSFGTINEPIVLGQHNEHEMITRLAFQCPGASTGAIINVKSDGICFEPRSLDQLAGTHIDVQGFPIPGGGMNGAVGAPDTLDPVPEGPEAHCDDADFIDMPGYPRTREQATQALQTCVDHLRGRFKQAWESAADLIELDEEVTNEEGSAHLQKKGQLRIRRDMVDLSPFAGGDCRFAFSTLHINTLARAKCATIEALGRALHGVQDFYAHSNWADEHDASQPIGVANPPGLGRNDTAAFLDLRAQGRIPEELVPRNLSTGCFVVPDATPGRSNCEGRVSHHTMNKDHGVVYLDGTFGEIGPGTPRTEKASEDNFKRAVAAAVEHSRIAWKALREELRERYGAEKGDLMICALVRDDPLRDCIPRNVAVVIDLSNQAKQMGVLQLERQVAMSLAVKMETSSGLHNMMTVVEFAESARVVFAMESPAYLNLEGAKLNETLIPFNENVHHPPNTTTRLPPHMTAPIHEGKADIAVGLSMAIDEILRTKPDGEHTERGAILLLTAGIEDENEDVHEVQQQIERASGEGIRVHYGCINPPLLPLQPSARSNASSPTECLPGKGVISSVLKTGGTFSFLSSTRRGEQTAKDFIDFVTNRGLTVTDGSGAGDTDEGEPLPIPVRPGMAIGDILSAEFPKKIFSYSAQAGERLDFTIYDRSLEGVEAPGGCLNMTLIDLKLLSDPEDDDINDDNNDDTNTTAPRQHRDDDDFKPELELPSLKYCTRDPPRAHHLAYYAKEDIDIALLVQHDEIAERNQLLGNILLDPDHHGQPSQKPMHHEHDQTPVILGEIIFTLELTTEMLGTDHLAMPFCPALGGVCEHDDEGRQVPLGLRRGGITFSGPLSGIGANKTEFEMGADEEEVRKEGGEPTTKVKRGHQGRDGGGEGQGDPTSTGTTIFSTSIFDARHGEGVDVCLVGERCRAR
ncbi:hypothetical protein B0T20DRAFT_411027 [Sordaria brevicollis]|uniref:VWFA domain-containing protein n=1 Tax=Sordaria brevicollis TaxID=83679 RepID=A0AAE0UBV5_SORBR|nr:hypothetical protein B0T20DRAFT_411027 [Sordaria brevicollis]